MKEVSRLKAGYATPAPPPRQPPPSPPPAPAEVDSIVRCLEDLGRSSESLASCVVLAQANADLVAGSQSQGEAECAPIGGGLVEQFRTRLGRLDILVGALDYHLRRARSAVEGCS